MGIFSFVVRVVLHLRGGVHLLSNKKHISIEIFWARRKQNHFQYKNHKKFIWVFKLGSSGICYGTDWWRVQSC